MEGAGYPGKRGMGRRNKERYMQGGTANHYVPNECYIQTVAVLTWNDNVTCGAISRA